jgi:hypothetical protein
MSSKNIFRTFLYVVVAIVLLKLCYNLGYRLVSKKQAPASRAAPVPTGISPDSTDTGGAALTTAAPDSTFK